MNELSTPLVSKVVVTTHRIIQIDATMELASVPVKVHGGFSIESAAFYPDTITCLVDLDGSQVIRDTEYDIFEFCGLMEWSYGDTVDVITEAVEKRGK